MPNEIRVNVAAKGDFDTVEKKARQSGDRIGQSLTQGADKAKAAFDGAARGIGRDLDRLEQEARQSGKGMDKAFTSSLAELRANLKRVQADAARTGKGLDSDLGDALRKIKSQSNQLSASMKGDLQEVEKSAKDAGEGIGSSLMEGLSSVLSGGDGLMGLGESLLSGKAGFVATGITLGGLLVKGIVDSVERGKVGAAVAASTGQASEAAARMGHIAGDLFSNSFGDSVEEAGAALTAVFQNGLIDPHASDAAIAELTGKIMTVGQIVGEDAERVSRSVHTMLVNRVARSEAEAMDIITRAAQIGVNTAGDLLDTIDEYSVQFSRVGLSGQEAMGLISQALQGGARDADVAADAIKEFAIRAQDGSVTTARGFEAIGLNADDMGNRIAAGGKTAHDALRLTLNALQQMPPGVERSTAAVDLFGTKAEDMGDALFSMDLDDAAEQFGDFGGSVEDAEKTLSDSIPIYETWGKNLQSTLTDIGEGMANLRDGFDSMVDGMSGVDGGMSAVRDAMANGTDATNENAEAQGKEADAVSHVTGTISEQVETLDEWIAKKQEAAGLTLDARDAERDYQEALDDASESIEKNKKNHDDNTAAGRENNATLDKLGKTALNVAEKWDKEGRSVGEVNRHMSTARARFVATAIAMGYSSAEANRLADQLKLIPRRVLTAVELRAEAARVNLANLKRAIDNIPRTITVSTYVRGANIVPGTGGHQFLAHGGIVPASHAAEGGPRGNMTTIDEQGPEVVELPSGARVATAGATRALAEAGAFAPRGGGGGSMVFEFGAGSNTDLGQFVQLLFRKGYVRLVDGSGQRVRVA